MVAKNNLLSLASFKTTGISYGKCILETLHTIDYETQLPPPPDSLPPPPPPILACGQTLAVIT